MPSASAVEFGFTGCLTVTSPRDPEPSRNVESPDVPVPVWAEMQLFDLLPENVQHALTETVMNVLASDAMRALYQNVSSWRLAGMIRELDKSHVAKTTIHDTMPNVQPLKRKFHEKLSKSYRARCALSRRGAGRL